MHVGSQQASKLTLEKLIGNQPWFLFVVEKKLCISLFTELLNRVLK